MDKKALETSVSYAWDDLGTAAVHVKWAAQGYVEAAQKTLTAFDEVQRQLTTIFMQNLSLEQAGQLMAELRKQPAGQMTVAFAEDTQLQAKLKSANDGKQAYRDARHAWRQAVEAAEAEGCEPTERFSQPDEVVDADQAIEAEAQITERLNALRAEIEQGARHVDTMVLNAQQSASVVPQAVPAAQAAPTVEAEVVTDSAAEDPLAMLDGMTDGPTTPVANQSAPDASSEAVVVEQPAQPDTVASSVPPSADNIVEDEDLPTPAEIARGRNPAQVAPPAQVVPSGNATEAEPGPEKEPIIVTGIGATVVEAVNGLITAIADFKFEAPTPDDVRVRVRDAEAARAATAAALETYVRDEDEQTRDPGLIDWAKEYLEDGEQVIGFFKAYLANYDATQRSVDETKLMRAAIDAYNAANQRSDSEGRAVAREQYADAHERLSQTYAQLKALDRTEQDYLDSLAEVLDEGGRNLAMMANRANVSAVAPEGDAHDDAWGARPAPAKLFDLSSMSSLAKPVGIGLAALLVVIAGVWIGSSGSSDTPAVTASVPAPVAAPTKVPAPAVPPSPTVAPAPAPRVSTPPSAAQSTPHVATAAPAPSPAPVVAAKPVVAPAHRPPVVHHVDALAREQAQLNAANAKLDAWARQNGQQP
ncbi:hypothetical protein [Burkholderia multivorans]|uniref:hypothetical protein n=1 Tax=Burkholderia multivorans TaxID=87883 RepID=UPI000CFF5196|nr:hypothetical protein [Burkholderia multivorans]PRG49767.1 hypothetical protein C6T62_01295 [Burkholderia multivorans]